MISLVVVNYRSAALAIDAIRSARATTSAPLEVVVVDNSESDPEADALRQHADTLVQSPRNIGYGAAINLAIEHCSGPVIVASNPDVVFDRGALDELAASVTRGAAVAGPALFWDAAHQWHLPPADPHTFAWKLDEALATRSAARRSARDRRRIAERAALWRRTEESDARALSGAVLAFDARVLQRERFDERFFLYFEETDLVRRIRHAGASVRYVPAARCRHLFNQSAGASDRAPAEFVRSEWLYHRKWYGAVGARLLMGLARPHANPPVADADSIHVAREGLLVEASPLRGFETAAGTFPSAGRLAPPAEIVRSLRNSPLFLRTVDVEAGRVIEEIRWREQQ